MIKNKKVLLFLLLLLPASLLFSQSIKDLRINEILVNNDTNYIDEYGRHVPWVEIFNSAYNSVNVSECYLTNDTTGFYNGTGVRNWYRIPKGDPATLIEQRSFSIFYMDDSPLYGTFHVNFDPGASGSSNYVALISSNGKTLLDIFYFPDSIRHIPHSYGCFKDGNKDSICVLNYFTPGSTNYVSGEKTKSELVLEKDPHGFGLALIAMSVVFGALFIIFIILKLFGRFSNAKKPKIQKEMDSHSVEPVVDEEDITGEELAAIAAALYLHFANQHDVESETITIENISAHYSPWSQKHLLYKRVIRKK